MRKCYDWLCFGIDYGDTIIVMVFIAWHRQQRGAAKWSPDAEFMKQFCAPVMYPDEVTSLWKMPPYNSKLFNCICCLRGFKWFFVLCLQAKWLLPKNRSRT